jgi:dihydrofolate reductase
MQVSLDGFVARPDGANDWIVSIGDADAQVLTVENTYSSDLIIMGRKMSVDFLSWWEKKVDGDRNDPEFPLATRMVEMQKIIFSKTLKGTNGRNARVENGDLKTEVTKLKNQPGKDIIVYGGANFVTNLIKADLIDEYILFINPIAIGEGLRIFVDTRKMKLVNSKTLPNGVVINHYKPVS